MTSCLGHYCWQPSIYSPQIYNLIYICIKQIYLSLYPTDDISCHYMCNMFISGPTTLTSRVVDCCIVTRKQTFYSIWTDYSSRAIWEYTAAKLWTVWKAQWKHSHLTIWFAGNGLAPTTNRYCGFNATLACSVMDGRCNIYIYMTNSQKGVPVGFVLLKSLNNFLRIEHKDIFCNMMHFDFVITCMQKRNYLRRPVFF